MKTPTVTILLVVALIGLPLSPEAGDSPTTLPASQYPVTIDGDPREAFLFGALHLPGVDPISGHADGAFRGYALALEEGLYAAAMDTVGKGANLVAVKATDPGDLLLGEWVALRLTSEGRERLYLLTPGGGAAVLDGEGRPVVGESAAWAGIDKRFGHTWAGEWLIPWAKIGAEPGDSFELALVRGRKLPVGGQRLEVLATTAPGISIDRFGATARALQRPPATIGRSTSPLRALENYEVRPFVAGPGEVTCLDWTPAGEVATAWFEVPPSERPARFSVDRAPAPPELFSVDFWWQAGTREEQDALFPARVAAGEGDVLLAERLLRLQGDVLAPHPTPIRIYVRLRIPEKLTPGERRMTIRCETSGRSVSLPWVVTVVPPLPQTDSLQGVFYLDQDPACWEADLRNMADHGVNAATCYARSAADQERFAVLARKVGIDGRFPMEPAAPTAPGTWGYAFDEPASAEAISGARRRAQELRARGAKPWAALCWPRSLELLPDLSGVAIAPGLLGRASALAETPDSTGGPRSADSGALAAKEPVGRAPSPANEADPSPKPYQGIPQGRLRVRTTRWVYFMGDREDPAYIRRMAAGLSRAAGLTGFWVWCYAVPSPGGGNDWTEAVHRTTTCREYDGARGLVDTVQWEALRDGIVDRRLAEAIGRVGGDSAKAAPELEPSRRGHYWLPEGEFFCGPTRASLARTWASLTP